MDAKTWLTDDFYRRWRDIVRGVASESYSEQRTDFLRLSIYSSGDLEQEIWAAFAARPEIRNSRGAVATAATHVVHDLLRKSETGKASVDSDDRLPDEDADAERQERDEESYFADPDEYETQEAGLVGVV